MGAASVDNPFNFFDYDNLRCVTMQPLRTGTQNLAGLRLNAALTFHKEFGFAEMEKRVLRHTSYIISRFKAQGVKVLTPDIASESRYC